MIIKFFGKAVIVNQCKTVKDYDLNLLKEKMSSLSDIFYDVNIENIGFIGDIGFYMSSKFDKYEFEVTVKNNLSNKELTIILDDLSNRIDRLNSIIANCKDFEGLALCRDITNIQKEEETMAGFINSDGRLIQFSEPNQFQHHVSKDIPPIVAIDRNHAIAITKALVQYEETLNDEEKNKKDENGYCISLAIDKLADQIDGLIYSSGDNFNNKEV